MPYQEIPRYTDVGEFSQVVLSSGKVSAAEEICVPCDESDGMGCERHIRSIPPLKRQDISAELL